MLETPEIPDQVPHFIQGYHIQDQGLLSAKTQVKAMDGSQFMVSTVQLGQGIQTFETLVFVQGGRGPAMPEFRGRYLTGDAAGYGHSMICNSIISWDPRLEGPFLLLPCLRGNPEPRKVPLPRRQQAVTRPGTVQGSIVRELTDQDLETLKNFLDIQPIVPPDGV